MTQVLGRSRRWSLGRHVGLESVSGFHPLGMNRQWIRQWLRYLAHPPIHDKVTPIDKAALVTGEEDDRIRLLDGLPEPARGEVNLTAETLGLVITQPVLEKRSA